MKELFEKFIKRECSEEEIEKIIDYINNSKELDDIPSIESLENQFEAYPDMEKSSADRIYKEIFAISKEINGPTTNKKLHIWRFAAAAIIIVFLTATFLFKDSTVRNSDETSPIIAKNNTTIIQAGTDKATLTLEDGSVIVLGKEKTYQAQNVNSDGEQIVYKGKKIAYSTEIKYNYLTIPRGGEFSIKLSDGTQVWLNSESQLKFPVNFREGETRQVDLVYGEAYFDVSPSTKHKGAKFEVFNKYQQIQVLGTEFNIKAYKDETNIYTTLVEGKVEITSGGKKQKLTPNQQLNLDLSNNQMSISRVDVYNEISWKNGIFVFKQKPLKDIMKVLSRWYDIDVVFKNKTIGDEEFIGSLGKNQNLEEILLGIKYSGLINNYKIVDKKVILE